MAVEGNAHVESKQQNMSIRPRQNETFFGEPHRNGQRNELKSNKGHSSFRLKTFQGFSFSVQSPPTSFFDKSRNIKKSHLALFARRLRQRYDWFV